MHLRLKFEEKNINFPTREGNSGYEFFSVVHQWRIYYYVSVSVIYIPVLYTSINNLC